MIFNQTNWEDIKKYFHQTYMKFPLIGDEVVFVDGVSPEGLTGKFLSPEKHGEGVSGWTFTFSNRENVDIEFILPRKSFFDYRGNACLLSRLPTKQYKRGLCNDNVSISMLTEGGFQGLHVTLEIINAYASKSAYQGFRMETGFSYTVAPRVAVDMSGKIYVDRIRVGYVDPNKGIINVNSELFLPEFNRILADHGQTVLKVVYSKVQPYAKTAKAKSMPVMEAV